MKKSFLFSFLFLGTCSVFGQSSSTTELNPQSKLGLLVTPKLGFAKLNETGNVPLNGTISGLDVLISMRIQKALYVQTGLGFFEFDGNRNLNGNTTSLQNNYLQIPLKFAFDLNVFENKFTNQNMYLTIGAGLYANTLGNQTTETIATTNNESQLGWNFGTSWQLGAKFNISKKLNLRMGYENQNDFSKMEKNGIERKINNLNAFYFGLEFKLK